MLQVATTWQSASRIKLPVLPGPCMPQPTTPIVMRVEGAGRPSAPNARAGMIVGAAMTAAEVAMKRRREILRDVDFMGSILHGWRAGREPKMPAGKPRSLGGKT